MTLRQQAKPRFEHDCDRCVFLGWIGHNDVYWCAQGSGAFKFPTIVMRYGNGGPQYESGWRFIDDLPEDMAARAKALGEAA